MATNGFRIRDLPRELRNQIFGLIAINETNSGFTQPFFLTSLGEVETAHAKVLAKCTTLSHDHKMVVNLYDEALEEYRKLDIRITVDNLAAFCALKRPRDWVRSITLVWEPDINDKERYLKFMNSGFRLKYGNNLDRLTIDLTKLSENRCHCCTITKWLVDFSGRLPIEENPTICVSVLEDPTVSCAKIKTHWIPSFDLMFQKTARKVDVNATLRQWVWEDEKTVIAACARSYKDGKFKVGH